MNDYIQVFCEQNPEFHAMCANPSCNQESTFSSVEVFSNEDFVFTCPYCNQETKIITQEFVDEFVNQLKALGITLG